MKSYAQYRAMARICVLSMLIAGSAFAQVTESPKENFKIEVSPENAITLKFADGREAQTTMYRTGYYTWPMPMSMTENMCNPEMVKANCRLILRAEMQFLMLNWTKNPDAGKVGTPVSFEYNQVFDGQLLHESEEQGQKDLLICDDYRWLTGNKDAGEINRHENIISWGSEANFTNTETTMSENRTIGGALDMELSGSLGRMYRISGYKNIAQNPTLPGLFSVGPISLVITDKTTRELCQVQFSPDISKAQILISKLIDQMFKETPTPNLTEYRKKHVLGTLKALQFKKGEFR
ncbi:hypothetical protein AZI86_07465 [Bdellovibrio bacteriovorus]|uniref:GLPGLI family protein n=1 Tax=Bdellovibrio bacteriovorus TaxID=959 RepID=A0A150WRC1_BDEBC|nr:hypothetical protein [Bdellovibrio bacteriovorus]KYG66864.1 hypothetical protein AZI86_07465 [Bdellovibrio bacteriovorus]